MSEKLAIRQGYGDGLLELAAQHEDVIVLDADLAHATGTLKFKNTYPERFFEAGIAEQNLIGMAAGLAHTGFVPFATSFAMFAAGRACEVIRNAVAYSNANVKIVGSHSGITPAGDGGTHQCIEDIAWMRAIPGMTVLCPCDYRQAKLLVKKAYEWKGPVYLRTSREPMPLITPETDDITIGKAQVLREGGDLCIISTGIMTCYAMEAAETLAAEGVQAAVLNIHTIKPLDAETILRYAQRCGRVLTMEEHNICGGLSEAVALCLLGKVSVRFDSVAVMDRFGQSGVTAELFAEYGLDMASILQKAKQLLLNS